MKPYELTQSELDKLWELCAAWAEYRPDWAGRLVKARRLLREGAVVPDGLMSWKVKSSAGDWHHVRVVEGRGSCDCKWWVRRLDRCSHLLAAALHFELFPVGPSPVPPQPPASVSLGRAVVSLEAICRANEARQAALRRVVLCGTLAA